MKIRHSRGGYETYRRNDGTKRHRPWGIWRGSDGKWYCACGWPVSGIR